MQQQMNFLDTLCGKTSPEHSVPTAVKTSEPSSSRSAPSAKKEFQFLDLRTGYGNLLGSYWETATVLPGGSSTHNTSESLKDADVSSLSEVLEMSVPEKYSLSAKACRGILRRAEKRGKVLPPMLQEALMEVVRSCGAEIDDADDEDEVTDDESEDYEDEESDCAE